MMIYKFRYIVIAIIWGSFQGINFSKTGVEAGLDDIVFKLSYGEMYFIPAYLIELGLMMVPYILFQIFFGTYIYSHFCSACVYFFSRQKNKGRWFLKESLQLYLDSFIFVSLIFVSCFGVAAVNNELVFSREMLGLLFGYIFIHTTWLFLLSLVINILSIRFGNNIGFTIVIIMQFALITMLMVFNNILSFDATKWPHVAEILLKINPISNLILKWHTCSISVIDASVHMLPINFTFQFSVCYFLILAIGIVCVGGIYIKNKEFIISDMEQEGI